MSKTNQTTNKQTGKTKQNEQDKSIIFDSIPYVWNSSLWYFL